MSVKPKYQMPANACDSHMHVFDRRFPETLAADDIADGSATVSAYRQTQAAQGTTRTVVVTPRNYDIDNAVTLDAISQLGVDHARGIATLRPDVTDSQLTYLHEHGIRGIRFTLYTPEQAPTTFAMIEPLAQRVHELGWHVQLHLTAQQIVEHRKLIDGLPTPFVFDHFARLPQPTPLAHDACHLVTGWLEAGRAWVKLSGPYLDSRDGLRGHYADMDHLARHWIDTAPDQLVWGSDWPHTSLSSLPSSSPGGLAPDTLIGKLHDWVDSADTLTNILVTNPTRLYGFAT